MKGALRFFAFVFMVFLILSVVIERLKKDSEIKPSCADTYFVINASNDRMHQRDWEMVNHSKSFCTSYESLDSLSLSIGEKRNRIHSDEESYEAYWGEVYSELVKESEFHLNFLVDSLIQLSLKKNLSRGELAELVVTFVQDIPYSYVRSKPCSETNNYGKPCVGNITFGLLSPYEFIHSLYGDCDTRAVLIYALLENLGFDPMIVVSHQYAHAMLALNIQATGDHLRHRGKNYYFWETTGKGWPIGILPPNSNNVNYWKIALVNER